MILFLIAYAFKAWGWQRLFAEHERPGADALACAGGAACVGGIGVGTVNAPLASVAVSVVPPRQAGMAAGVNNTFRQVGIATGIAGLGAILQRQHDYIAGMNNILLVASFIAFAGAILGFALVRTSDLVASGPQRQGAESAA